MYLYPKNLKAKAQLWFWYLKDIVVITILSIIAVLLLVYGNILIGLVLATIYAILTIRLEDTSVMDFIKHACIFFLTKQEYGWKE